MTSFRNITRWLHVVIATLVVWSEPGVQRVFAKLGFHNFAILALIIIAIFGMQIADSLALGAIEHFRWLRRLLAGGNDIEGDWVNIVVNTSRPLEILYCEYCRMRYTNESYVLSGDTWTLDGKWIGAFSTNGSNYQGREFEYYYKTGLMRVGGFGYIVYSPADSLPTEFLCRYIDEEIVTPHVARGRRLTRHFGPVSMEDRKRAALAFARDFHREGLLDLQAVLNPRPEP
jgi:hypothetical protein